MKLHQKLLTSAAIAITLTFSITTCASEIFYCPQTTYCMGRYDMDCKTEDGWTISYAMLTKGYRITKGVYRLIGATYQKESHTVLCSYAKDGNSITVKKAGLSVYNTDSSSWEDMGEWEACNTWENLSTTNCPFQKL